MNNFFNNDVVANNKNKIQIKNNNKLSFGPTNISRVNTVPPMRWGRPGDLVIVDNTASSTVNDDADQTGVGLYMKYTISQAAEYNISGTVISSSINPILIPGDSFLLNSISIPITTNLLSDLSNTITSLTSLTSIVLNNSLYIIDVSGNDIIVQNQQGNVLENFGFTNERGSNSVSVNGYWLPVNITSITQVSRSSVVIDPIDAVFPKRLLNSDGLIVLTDNGPGNDLRISASVQNLPTYTGSVNTLDWMIVWNSITNQFEKIHPNQLSSSINSSTSNVAASNVTSWTSGLPMPIGPIVPQYSYVDSITIVIETAFLFGDYLELTDNIGTVLTSGVDFDHTIIGETVVNFSTELTVDTQYLLTISGSGSGKIRVFVNYY